MKKEKITEAFDNIDESLSSYEKTMDSFDRINESMNKTFNAIYFLYGGLVTLMIVSIIEAIQ